MKITTNRLLVGLLVLMPLANSAIARQNDRAREQQAREQQAREQQTREQKARADAARKAEEQQLHDRDAAARNKAEEEKAKRIENARKEAKENGPVAKDPNPRAVADEIVKLEAIHREHVARIHRLMEVYRESKNEARLKELEELNAAWTKRYENARNRLKQRAGDAEFNRIDRALDHGRKPGADNAKRIDNARDKAELDKREENARKEREERERKANETKKNG